MPLGDMLLHHITDLILARSLPEPATSSKLTTLIKLNLALRPRPETLGRLLFNVLAMSPSSSPASSE